VTLDKLVFQIGDRTIELTKLEAMQLQQELNDLFWHPAESVPWTIPISPFTPYFTPLYPLNPSYSTNNISYDSFNETTHQ
jgi:hypothetical protein